MEQFLPGKILQCIDDIVDNCIDLLFQAKDPIVEIDRLLGVLDEDPKSINPIITLGFLQEKIISLYKSFVYPSECHYRLTSKSVKESAKMCERAALELNQLAFEMKIKEENYEPK